MTNQIAARSNQLKKIYLNMPVLIVLSKTKVVLSNVATKHAASGSATKKDKMDLLHISSSI